MGPWKKFESTVVRLKRSYEDTESVVCLTTKGRQLERNFEELKPASHVPILGFISIAPAGYHDKKNYLPEHSSPLSWKIR
jgi:hypothetical protein